MKLSTFDHVSAMEQEALALLREHFGFSCAEPHAVMLTGGRTPLGLYRTLETSPGQVDAGLHLLISDERHVPPDSPENNFARMLPMIHAMGLDDSRVIRVHTELPLRAAARRYHQQLASYLEDDGRITLGILGLGADGHLASLFSLDDVNRGTGRYAVAVPREDGPDRVSVTRGLLLRVERLVFLLAGPEKAQIVDRIINDPHTVTAARVVEDARRVELWYAA